MKIADIEVSPIHPKRWGDDLDVVDAARASMGKNSEWENDVERELLIESLTDGCVYEVQDPGFVGVLSKKDVGLIQYLAKHKHLSPFNHSFLKFYIKAPVFVARQLVKHKFMPWNEISRRYVDTEPEFYFPDNWRVRAENIKQGSLDERNEAMYLVEDDDIGIYPSTDEWAHMCVDDALRQYNQMLAKNVPPEQARMILPQNMMCEWRWSGTLGAFLDMLVLRLDPHTQKESRDVANLIAMHVQRAFPVSFDARINK